MNIIQDPNFNELCQSHCHVLFRFKMLSFNYVLNKNVPVFWKLGFTRFVLRISTCRATFPPRIDTFRYVISTFCYVQLVFDTYLLGFYFVSVFDTFVVELFKTYGACPVWNKGSLRFNTLRCVYSRFATLSKRSKT